LTAPTRWRAPFAQAPPDDVDPSLTVLARGRKHRHEPGCSGHVLRGGELRIFDRRKHITAVYPAGTWTLLPGADPRE
jgi:hypothetical protein